MANPEHNFVEDTGELFEEIGSSVRGPQEGQKHKCQSCGGTGRRNGTVCTSCGGSGWRHG